VVPAIPENTQSRGLLWTVFVGAGNQIHAIKKAANATADTAIPITGYDKLFPVLRRLSK